MEKQALADLLLMRPKQVTISTLTCPPTNQCGRGCGATSPIEEWTLTEVGCEDCGTHEAVRCPRCESTWDLVWHDIDPATGAIERC